MFEKLSYNSLLSVRSKIIQKYDITFTHSDIHKLSISLKIILFLLVLCVIYIFNYYNIISLTFAFIHELGHAIVAISYNLEILEFVVEYPKSYVIIDPSYVNPTQVYYIAMAGSLSVIIVSTIIILWMIFNNKIKFEIFSAIFIVSVLPILDNILYWFYSIENNKGDFAYLKSIIPNISTELIYRSWINIGTFLSIILIYLFCFKIIFLVSDNVINTIPDLKEFKFS